MAAPTEEAETAEFVPKKRTNGSIIWRYFGFRASDEEQKEPLSWFDNVKEKWYTGTLLLVPI